MAITFARAAARFEAEYLFVWMDWDGDNILANGGIIDYGSVRQFGLYHHEYRYDDVDRMSTTIPEQRMKARAMVQTFAQIRDFLATGQRKRRNRFARDPVLKLFDKTFEDERLRLLLGNIGFDPKTRDALLLHHRQAVENFRQIHAYFERCKVRRGPYKVPDGITWDAIYCMRDVLRELPRYWLDKKSAPPLDEFIEMLASSYARRSDRVITTSKGRRMRTYLKLYQDLIIVGSTVAGCGQDRLFLKIAMRSSLINRADRITGNAALLIAERIFKAKGRLERADIQRLIETFIAYQTRDPRAAAKIASAPAVQALPLGRALLRLVKDYRETI